METKVDLETATIVRQEKTIEDLCKHEAWSTIRQKFMDKVLDLQSVRNIALSTPEKMAIEMQARMLAIDILMEWFQDIEGTAEKSKDTSFTIKRESYIFRKE